MSSTANRIIKNTGFLYAKMGITMFISLYTTRLILNSLGASDFGIFNIVGGSIAMLGFLNAAMASATQRFMSYSEGEGNKEKQKSIFNVSFILHLVISFIIAILLIIAGYFFFNGILNIPEGRIFAAQVIYASLIVSTMFTVMTVPYDAVMNAHENMKYYAIVGIFESLLKLIVAFICVYSTSDKLIVYGSLMACIPLITLTIMRIYCHRHYEECRIDPKKYWNKAIMKDMTSFAGWIFLSTSSSMIGQYGLGVIINHFLGALLNAAQGITNQINGQILTLSNNFIKAINPIIGKSAGKRDLFLLQKATAESTRATTILYGMVACPIFLYTPYIMTCWLKNVPEWTVLFIRLIIICYFVELQYLSYTNAVRSVGFIKNMSKWELIINLLPIFLTYILFLNKFAPYYLYVALFISRIFLMVNTLYYAKKYCNISYSSYFKTITFPLNLIFIVITAIMFGFSTYYPCNNFLALIISVMIYFIFFIISILAIINKEEKLILQKLIQKIKLRN